MTLRKTFFQAFIAAALLVQVTTSLLDLRAAYRDAMDRAGESLQVARAVALSFLEERNHLLEVSAKVLAGDFALRSAVATADLGTVESALRNHSSRINADVAFFVNLEGRAVAASQISGAIDSALWQSVQSQPDRMVVLEDDAGSLFQIVPATVKAPQVIGWVALGFRLDQTLVEKLKAITGSEVSLTAAVADGVSISTRDAVLANEPETHWLNAVHALDNLGTTVELTFSRAREEALASFYRQRQQSMWLILLSLAVAVVLAIVLTSRLTRDLGTLAEVAAGVREGNYDLDLPKMRGLEVQQLARALTTMRQGIVERESRIGHQLLYDSLTDLPNKRHALDLLDRWAGDPDAVYALVVHVGGLQAFSSTLGLEFGDRAICRIAELLNQESGAELVARIADTRFLLLLRNVEPSQVEALAQRIAHQHRVIQIGEQAKARCSFEFGAAVAPADVADALPIDGETLISNAWSASLESLARRGALTWFEEDFRARDARRQVILRDLRAAVFDNQLHLLYQLKWNAETRSFRSVEALLRWVHPELGPVNVEEMVQLAEQTQEIRLLTRWVLQEALRQQADWRRRGIDLDMAVNISALDLSGLQFAEYVQAVLAEHQIPGQALCLEVTEGALVNDFDQAKDTIDHIASHGVRFAIDDYGTGFSSLSQIRNLTAHTLKIDKSFVMTLDESPADQEIVASTIKLAHSLGLTVVAEGVENEAAVELLCSWGCDDLQGYFFSKPLPPEAVEARLASASEQTGSPVVPQRA
ncbi:MAG: EAL domain-containing protein [Pseudomonadota bacterium]